MLPSGLLSLAEIAALADAPHAAAVQLPAIEHLFDHVSSLARANLGAVGEQDYDADAHLSECGVSPEVVQAARLARKNLSNGFEDGVSETRLRRAVRDFQHAITARAQEQLTPEQRDTVLGRQRHTAGFDTPPDLHYPPPVREEEVAMKGLRYGCGCMSVGLMVTVIPVFVEAALSERIFTPVPEAVMDAQDALETAAFAIVASVVCSLIYRRLFAKHFEVKVLLVSFVLALTLGGLATVVGLAERGNSQQEIDEFFEPSDTSK